MKDIFGNMQMLVLSCDKYQECWKPFFKLLDKYWKEHPKAYIVAETKGDINVDSECWSKRFRKAVEQVQDEYIFVMLEDFFIRSKVDNDRINKALEFMKEHKEIAVINFEKQYRKGIPVVGTEYEAQINNQMYLCSCQPSIWRKEDLLSYLQEDINAWEWETQVINTNKLHLINTTYNIIDIGYNHTLNWGISRGSLTEECAEFLKSEGVDFKWNLQ